MIQPTPHSNSVRKTYNTNGTSKKTDVDFV